MRPASSVLIPARVDAGISGAGLSTPSARETSENPAATSIAAWRTALEPVAEAFSTWVIGMPVPPRCLSMTRVGAIPRKALP